jgi:hypothetical protein
MVTEVKGIIKLDCFCIIELESVEYVNLIERFLYDKSR